MENVSFQPTQTYLIDIAEPLALPSASDEGAYVNALVLVRLYGKPLGWAEFDLTEGLPGPEKLAAGIWAALGTEINQHLAAHGLPPVETLGAEGLSVPELTPGPPPSQPFVSVVIPTHNRPEAVEVGLDALLALDYPHYEVIVVDNAPATSATADLLKAKYSHLTNVHYLLEEHPNASLARNQGLARAQGEIVAFLDDDSIAAPTWLTHITAGFAIAPDVACVNGLIAPTAIETPTQAFFQKLWVHGGYMRGFERQIFDMDAHRLDDPLYPYRATVFGSGGNMAFRASVLREIGGFDPVLGPGSPALAAEELDAFFRVVTNGYQLVYEPAAIAFHPNPPTYESLVQHVYSFGVGLTAFVTKCFLTNPMHLLRFIAKLPYALYFALSPSSARNRRQGEATEYTRTLARADVRGLVYGPVAYLRSRWEWFRAQRRRQPQDTKSHEHR